MDKYMDLIDKEQKALTSRVLDTYDTGGRKHTMEYYNTFRKNAVADGIQIMVRNFFKMVVDKSGMLWNSKEPVLEVWEPGADQADDIQSAAALGIMQKAQWVEFFTNLDPIVRALRTVYVLPHFDPMKKRWAFDLLHQENCAVVNDEYGTPIMGMYYVGKAPGGFKWRVYTPEDYKDIIVDSNGNEKIGESQPNPLGMVPFAPFHDTNVPRYGEWNAIPMDLLDANHHVNVAYTDSAFTSMWIKNPTLYTDAELEAPIDENGNPQVEIQIKQFANKALPTAVASAPGTLAGGPGRVIGVKSTNDSGSVFAEFLAPSAPLKELDDVVQNWMINFAADWAVNARTAGTGSADSGFKLIVEEMPNLELRKKRQRMQEAGFKRLWEIIRVMANQAGVPVTLTGELYVKFAAPELPVDEKATEDVWDRRIQQGRATRVDYFMAVQGLTRDEAERKIAEIDAAPKPNSRIIPTSAEKTTVAI